MPGFKSRSQIDKLGKHLASEPILEQSDLLELQRLRAAYDEPMATVREMVEKKLGLHATSRLKTVNTIIDKLKREGTRLSTMQDVAGLRLVKDMTIKEQDEVSRNIAETFPGAKLVDRRREPSHGYRAVHVIVQSGEFLVEIQVRTRLQDLWAQAFEKAADLIGREIRYGAIPKNSAHRSIVEMLMEMSDEIVALEDLVLELEQSESASSRIASHGEEYLSLRTQHEERKNGMLRRLSRLLGTELQNPGEQK